MGGRNVGDEYFDAGDELQFGDYDVLAQGADRARSVHELRRVLEQLAFDSGARAARRHADRADARSDATATCRAPAGNARQDEERAIRTGQPLASLLANDSGVVWAKAEALVDNPDKASVEGGDAIGALFRCRLLRTTAEVTTSGSC